jgi:hypothetical protein
VIVVSTREFLSFQRAARVLIVLGFVAIGAVGILIATAAVAQDSSKPGSAPATSAAASGNQPNGPRYTFSWPLSADPELAPRGGTTRGPEMALDNTPSAAWKALQAPGLAALERDRRAILAMAGAYRVTFDFLEVTPFAPDAKRDKPYQSWGTERVYVDRDDGKYISLSHILEMRIVDKDGKVSEPFVTKHWRQDWQYEPAEIVVYLGRERWGRRVLRRHDVEGQWSQTVYQVDDSPRYASVGKWEHSPSMSTWISGETWRPLPRREWSVRKDYQVLVGTNRHTIIPTGWVQEENNLKGVLTEDRRLSSEQPYLAREYGVARYERLAAPDFAAADQYYERTRAFWAQVRDAWAARFRATPQITLRAQVDQAGLFRSLFEHADKLAAGENVSGDNTAVINASLSDMGAGAAPRR